MLTEKDYCDYETCVALKELGYPTKMTFVSEFGSIEIPINSGLIQLYEAQKWLREEKNLYIEISYSPACWTCKIYDLKEWDYIKGFTFLNSFEEAFSEGVRTSIKLLQDEQKENN